MDKELLYGDTFAAVKAGLTGISGAATTHSTGATTIQFAIEGKAYSKAQISGGATPTTDAVTAAAFLPLTANKGCAVVWGLDSSGNVKCAQGPIADLDASGNFAGNIGPTFAGMPDSVCAIAYTLHKNGSTGTSWLFGSANWNQAGMTHVVQDVLRLPRRPQTS